MTDAPNASVLLTENVEEWYKNRIKLPTRSAKFGVGKWIGGILYVHRQYEDIIPSEIITKAKATLEGFPYTIVKYEPKTGNLSFLECNDWDTADEPTVGRSIVVKPDGAAKVYNPPTDPWIYHHKWLFVADDYQGFDVEAAKERSRQWMAVQDVNKSKIGKKSYWNNNVVPKIGKEKYTFVKDDQGNVMHIEADASCMDTEESIAELNKLIIKANAQGIDVKLQGQNLAPFSGSIPENREDDAIIIDEMWFSNTGIVFEGALDRGDIRVVSDDKATHVTYLKSKVSKAAVNELLEDLKQFGADNIVVWNGEELNESFNNVVAAAKCIVEDLTK